MNEKIVDVNFWPFLVDTGYEPNLPKITKDKLNLILENIGNFQDFDHLDDVVKFWVSESAEAALKELAEHNGISLSESLRQLFFTHCYGLYAYKAVGQLLQKARDENKQRFSFNDPDDQILFSRRRDPIKGEPTFYVANLGKNISPIRLMVSARLKNDLSKLAEFHKKSLSHYLCEVVVSRLFGHGFLPMQLPKLTNEENLALEEWLRDD